MCVFKRPKIVAPTPAPVTAADDSAVQEKVAQMQRRLLNRQGYAANLLTGAQGVSPGTTPTATRTLLGMGG